MISRQYRGLVPSLASMASPATCESFRLKPFFSDQSHLLFYGCSSPAQCKTVKAHLHAELSSSSPLCRKAKQAPPQLAAHPSPALTTGPSTCSEPDLLKELAVLKAQVKLKKKQLKAAAKEKKKILKKDKAKGKGASSSFASSSSSEESDGGRRPCSKKLLKERELLFSQNVDREERDVKQTVFAGVVSQIDSPQGRNAGIGPCMPLWVEPRGLPSSTERLYTQNYNTIPLDTDNGIVIPPYSISSADLAQRISGNIEVCVGGKCKKAGSHQLLSSFEAQIPSSARVSVNPCKCMGKCGAAMNVKVRKQDTDPQLHSHVSVDAVGLILSQHFDLGTLLSGLPTSTSMSSLTP